MTGESNITAIILAGGKSSRMGADKGLVELNGIKMIDRVLQNVTSVLSEVVISINLAGYDGLGYPVVRDLYKNCGPLGGIHAGLKHTETPWNLVLACDLPFISGDFLRFLLSNIAPADAVVPVHDKLAEPLCALYHKSSLPKIESLLLKQEFKMQNALKILDSKFVVVPEDLFDASLIFKNINTAQDLSAASRI